MIEVFLVYTCILFSSSQLSLDNSYGLIDEIVFVSYVQITHRKAETENKWKILWTENKK